MSVILQDLTVSYNRHPAIHHVSGTFADGTSTAIAGPNGAGKSTLLKAIAGIMPVNSGQIVFEGINAKDIAYLPQAAEINRDFPMSVLQLVCSGYWQKRGGYKKIGFDLREKAKYALAKVGLMEFESRDIGSLSVGQFQRILFARLILEDARLILLDEPFTAIDAETTAKLQDVIRSWQAEKRTIICVLHDINQIRDHFSNCLLLARKCIAWGESVATLNNDNLFNAKLSHEAWRKNAEVREA